MNIITVAIDKNKYSEKGGGGGGGGGLKQQVNQTGSLELVKVLLLERLAKERDLLKTEGVRNGRARSILK